MATQSTPSNEKMTAPPANDASASPPRSSLDNNDAELKEHHKVEAAEYLEHGVGIDEEDFKRKEKALVRKLDLYVVPLLPSDGPLADPISRYVAPVMMMLMLVSYLDRGNIGFAATQGMSKDIGLKGNQLNVRSPPGPNI